MPVRSLSSSVLAWPGEDRVEPALAAWALELSTLCNGLLGVGYYGSNARGDWGVGSDLDLVVVLEQSQSPFGRRSLPLETRMLPVPVDMLIYTRRELEETMQRGGRFPATLLFEAGNGNGNGILVKKTEVQTLEANLSTVRTIRGYLKAKEIIIAC